MRKLFGPALGWMIGMAAILPGAMSARAQEVNVYSYRQPELIAPLLKAFTAQTGIRTHSLFLDKGLEERIAAEGINSPADLILTVDVGRLTNAKAAGVTQAVDDPAINRHIPPQFRDPQGHWFGLTTRGRVVYASRQRVAQDTITYEELADPKWKGKVCMRDGQHVYNIGLFASMIAHHGADYTETWLKGLKENLARKPAGNDREQAKAIFAGQCDIALGNTYYVGLMMTNDREPAQKEWAAAIKILFPNAPAVGAPNSSDGRGTHVNISGMALTKYAPHKQDALKLMAFLASPEAQQIYARQVFEYPIAPGAEPSDIVKSFGEIHPDSLPLGEVAKYRRKASELVDKVGLNDGPSS